MPIAKPSASHASVTPRRVVTAADEAQARAAANAAVALAVKTELARQAAEAKDNLRKVASKPSAAKPTLVSTTNTGTPAREPKAAARALRDFLVATQRFGSTADRPNEIMDAQADMGGLKPDGIVGPKTRARARALGFTLPIKPTK